MKSGQVRMLTAEDETEAMIALDAAEAIARMKEGDLVNEKGEDVPSTAGQGMSLLDKYLPPNSLGRILWDTNVKNLRSLVLTGQGTGARCVQLPPHTHTHTIPETWRDLSWFDHESYNAYRQDRMRQKNDSLFLSLCLSSVHFSLFYVCFRRYSPEVHQLALMLLSRAGSTCYNILAEALPCLQSLRSVQAIKGNVGIDESGVLTSILATNNINLSGCQLKNREWDRCGCLSFDEM